MCGALHLVNNDDHAFQGKVSDENIWHETQRAPVAALKFLDDATKATSGEVKELVINRARALTCIDAEWSDETNF